ncbi:Na+/H+ antiporter NhaC [uncultured Aquimonas sp.]|uniref:Na+/H+ antiporter NhaC n=1 Tax=uncultured Aquimonas sp. TaxID=385483 RepID=UPI00086CCDEA|nr:Na+/H+ antiporter NhaC [uncultured Aquimonas sp.]ODU45289.1 MAG: Na+/H+ antiporter NhaC [Xanthomonadaceae bacterium SCN 69-123]
MSDTATAPRRDPSLLQALLPLVFLVAGLASSVYLYGADSSYGANQIALLLAGGVAGIIGIYNGLRWDDIQAAITRGIALATPALLILLAVGALIGTWILSGTVPALIVYGLKLMDPSFFYPAACLICAIVALAIGSSWTVAGTLGVALMGVASGLDMSPAITAGAVISGAYFGDKMSPLSDTTNLAPAAAGGELFTHVRHMAWTTVPAFVIAMIAFAVVGLGASTSAGGADFGDLAGIMGSHFNLGLHLLIPLVVVFALAVKRFPAYPTILIGALLGAVFAVLFQPDRVVALAGSDELTRPWALLSGAWKALATGYSADTGNEAVNELISRGGMSSMLNTVWLILCAMAFGAVMESVGLLERLIRGVLALARSTGSLITATIATALGCNLVAADQYMAIVLTGRLFKPEYEKRGLAPENLSRALEDGGTLTSPLVPWNTCGAYMAVTLGVSTIDYLPYVFFNLISPVLAGVLAYFGYKIARVRATA